MGDCAGQLEAGREQQNRELRVREKMLRGIVATFGKS